MKGICCGYLSKAYQSGAGPKVSRYGGGLVELSGDGFGLGIDELRIPEIQGEKKGKMWRFHFIRVLYYILYTILTIPTPSGTVCKNKRQ